MNRHLVRHRPQQTKLVHPLRQQRQVLAELNPGHSRIDRLEFAPDLQGCLGLHVPEVDMAGSAKQEDEDARRQPIFRSPPRVGQGPQPCQIARGQSERTQASNAQ